MAWVDVIAWDRLEPGRPVAVRVGTRRLVVLRDGDEAHVTDALCPHKFTPLEEGHVESGCLVCPTHDAGFRLADGAPRAGDGWAGRLDVHPARVVDGQVQADL